MASFMTLRNVLKSIGATDDRIQERFVISNTSGVVSGDPGNERQDIVMHGRRLDTEEFARWVLTKVFDKTGGDSKIYHWRSLLKHVARLGIATKTEYFRMVKADRDGRLIDHPDRVYKKYWTDWYEFLGVDKRRFIKDKAVWKQVCIDEGVSCWDDYTELARRRHDVPLMPEEIYRGFTNLDAELGIDDDLFL